MNYADVFRYEPESGRLVWAVKRACPGGAAGNEVGSVKADGRYRTVLLNGRRLYVHRVIWEMLKGPIPERMCIDHLDGNGLNNRADNLRLATLSQNQRNRRLGKSNRSGIAGVFAQSGGYSVYCASTYVTFTKDFFEACCARKSAELRNGYLSRKAA